MQGKEAIILKIPPENRPVSPAFPATAFSKTILNPTRRRFKVFRPDGRSDLKKKKCCNTFFYRTSGFRVRTPFQEQNTAITPTIPRPKWTRPHFKETEAFKKNSRLQDRSDETFAVAYPLETNNPRGQRPLFKTSLWL